MTAATRAASPATQRVHRYGIDDVSHTICQPMNGCSCVTSRVIPVRAVLGIQAGPQPAMHPHLQKRRLRKSRRVSSDDPTADQHSWIAVMISHVISLQSAESAIACRRQSTGGGGGGAAKPVWCQCQLTFISVWFKALATPDAMLSVNMSQRRREAHAASYLMACPVRAQAVAP